MNAIKFGFYARAVVMEGEDPQAYEILREQLWADLNPQNGLEAVYVREIVDTFWRLQRLGLVEATVFTRRSVSFSGHQHGPGFAFINDDQGHATLSHLTNYEATLYRRLHRGLEQLRKLRLDGWKDATPSTTEESGGTDATRGCGETQRTAKHPLKSQPDPQVADAKKPRTPGDPPSSPAVPAPPRTTSESDKVVTLHSKGAQPKENREGFEGQPPPEARDVTKSPTPCAPLNTPEAPVPLPAPISESDKAVILSTKGDLDENRQGTAI